MSLFRRPTLSPPVSRLLVVKRAARRLWAWLMTPVGKRVPVGKRGAPHGIALLTVVTALTLMTTVVADLGYNEMVRYKLAAHDRDAMRAQALAESGVNLSRLLLAVQAAVQPMLTQLAQTGMPLPAFTVWELVPLESELLKSLAEGELQSAFGIDVSAALEERAARAAEREQDIRDAYESEEAVGTGPFIPPASGFGAFQGTFSVKVEDEERKAASLRGWMSANTKARFNMAQRLFLVFQPERYDFLFEDRDAYGDRTDRYELVANIFDYIDTNQDATDPRGDATNWGRAGGSSEDALYSSYDVEPKNEYFDSPAELRLVRGMSDAHMKAFADSISIYGENKINILSAPPQSIETLVRLCAANPQDPRLFDPVWMRETVSGWMQCKAVGVLGGGCAVSADGFINYLQTGFLTQGAGIVVDPDTCKDSIGTESKNFTITSTGTVGDVQRTVTLVVRVHGPIEERYFYSIVK